MINTSTNSSFPSQVVPVAEKLSWEYGLQVAQAIEYEWFRGGRINSGKWYTGVAAVASGAEILEFHAVFDRRMFGPDSSSSLTMDEISQLAEAVRFLEKAQQHPVDKHDNSAYTELKQIFEKSLAVRRDLPAGHKLQFDDLEAKKPAGQGIPASEFREVLGKTLKQAKQQYEFLNFSDV